MCPQDQCPGLLQWLKQFFVETMIKKKASNHSWTFINCMNIYWFLVSTQRLSFVEQLLKITTRKFIEAWVLVKWYNWSTSKLCTAVIEYLIRFHRLGRSDRLSKRCIDAHLSPEQFRKRWKIKAADGTQLISNDSFSCFEFSSSQFPQRSALSRQFDFSPWNWSILNAAVTKLVMGIPPDVESHPAAVWQDLKPQLLQWICCFQVGKCVKCLKICYLICYLTGFEPYLWVITGHHSL